MNCNKNYQKQSFIKNFKKRFANGYAFSSHDTNETILLLRKGVYPFEYMDDWEKFNDTLLPKKEDFYSNLNLEDITKAD